MTEATFTTIAQIEAAPTKELIAYWNSHAAKPITKFSDRATAVKRCVDLMTERGELDEKAEKSAELIENEEVNAEEDAEKKLTGQVEGEPKGGVWPFPKAGEETAESLAAKAALDAEPEAKPVTKKASSGTSNAAGVAASWCDPTVAQARLKRDGVSVTIGDDVQTFKSTRDAFRALRLMDSKHIRFRGELKKSGVAIYTENGIAYVFAII